MKKFTCYLFLLSALLFSLSATAQERYLSEVFTGVSVQKDITYASNISVLTGAPRLEELKMDVYTPVGDDATNRPVVVVLHTGSFLPPLINGGITGARSDSAVVEICRRLARHGYVAIAATYRLGWNPVASGEAGQDIRTGTLLNAAYRGVQDARACIRNLRKSVVDENNKYGIDPDKICLWGLGTGGYISLGAGFLDRFNEEVAIDKFIGQNLLPYVDTTLNGNVYGTNQTPLNVPNHVGYSSDFKLAINMGGALGDISWLEGKAGEPATLGFHCVRDPFAPFNSGAVIVPTTGDFVVNVSGTRAVVGRANEVGINAVFDDVNAQPNVLNSIVKALSQVSAVFPSGDTVTLATDNMYPFLSSGLLVGPWEWWDTTTLKLVVAGTNAFLGTTYDWKTLHGNGLLTNPKMSKTSGMAYIDTIMAYTLPRAYAALNLATATKEVLNPNQVKLQFGPNPGKDIIFFQTGADYPMLDVAIYNLEGKLVKAAINMKNNSYEFHRGNLPPGLYVAQIRFKEGIVPVKIMLE